MEQGRFYHIFNRGNNRENIFKEEENYFYFLKKYWKYVSGQADTYAYCLMPNHFHLLVKIKEQNIPVSEIHPKPLLTPVEKAFKDFFISYAKSINKRYDRVGSLFQYKFKRKEVYNEEYLHRLVRYIHLNPVEAGFCEKTEDWKFSSYSLILNNSATFEKASETLSWFGDRTNFENFHQVKNSGPDFLDFKSL